MPIPMTLFFMLLGIAMISIFFLKDKKQKKSAKIYLIIGIILILITLIFWIALSLQGN